MQIIVQYCACCARCARRSKADHPDESSQFIKEEGSYGAAAFGMQQQQQGRRRRCTCTSILQWSIALLALATAGVSCWGIQASLANTDSQVSNFWGIVDQIDAKVNSSTILLNALASNLATLQTSAVTIDRQAAGTFSL